jgi:hypothetical protein
MKHRHPVTTGHAIGSSAGGMEITAGAPPVPPGALLGQAVPRHLILGDHLRGFGGIHGGLALALMTSAMQGQAAGEPLRSVTARYHRPITGEFRIEVTPIRSGQAVRTLVRPHLAGTKHTWTCRLICPSTLDATSPQADGLRSRYGSLSQR